MVAGAFVFLLFLPSRIQAPAVIPNEKGSIVVSESGGKPRWTADWTMEPSSESGQPAVHFSEHGRGRYTPYTTDVQWSIDAVWLAKDGFYPLRVVKTFTDRSGKVLSIEKKTFDPKTSTVRIERGDTRTLNAPGDTLTIEGIAGVLRFLPFESSRAFPVHLLSNEPRIYDITIEPRGRERVRTPAGEFDCLKVELVAHMGVLNLFKPFFGKTYFWFSASAPHFWVKYEGYENGVGTPRIVMELKSYER